jgi:hypothetical protein
MMNWEVALGSMITSHKAGIVSPRIALGCLILAIVHGIANHLAINLYQTIHATYLARSSNNLKTKSVLWSY